MIGMPMNHTTAPIESNRLADSISTELQSITVATAVVNVTI